MEVILEILGGAMLVVSVLDAAATTFTYFAGVTPSPKDDKYAGDFRAFVDRASALVARLSVMRGKK